MNTLPPVESYIWPCDKRIAHGPHETCPDSCSTPPVHDCDKHDLCPGVAAHPHTQIGRGTLPRKPKPIPTLAV